MNIIILKCFILIHYLIKKSSQTSNLKNDDDYVNVYLTSFESPSKKGDYEDYEARLSIPMQYIQKQNSPGDNSYGTSRTIKQDRPPLEKCSKIGTEIVNLLNDYRNGLKLSTLALDDDLCFVAKMHVLANKARHGGGGGELTHDWDPPPASPTPSIKWDPMRFDPEIPSKLIGYSGNIAGENAAVGAKTAKQVIDMWKASPGHNDLMVSSGSWKDMKSKGAGADCDISETYLCYLWIGDGEVKQATDSTIDGSGSGNKELEGSGSGNSPEGSRHEVSSQEGSGYGNVGFSPNGFPLKGSPFEGYLPQGFSPEGYFPAVIKVLPEYTN